MASAPPLNRTACVVHYESCGKTADTRLPCTQEGLEGLERGRVGSFRVGLPRGHLSHSWDDSFTTPHRYSSLKPNTAAQVQDMPPLTAVRHQWQGDIPTKKSHRSGPVFSKSIPSLRSTGAGLGETSLTTNAEILENPSWNCHLNAWVSSRLGQSNTYISFAEQEELIDRGVHHYMPEFLESPILPCPRYVEHMHSRPVLKPIPTGRKKTNILKKPKFWKWKGRTVPVVPKFRPMEVREKTPPLFPQFPPSETDESLSPSSTVTPSPQSTTPASPTTETPLCVKSSHPPPPPSRVSGTCDLSFGTHSPPSPQFPSLVFQSTCSDSPLGPPAPAPSIVSDSSSRTTPDINQSDFLPELSVQIRHKTTGELCKPMRDINHGFDRSKVTVDQGRVKSGRDAESRVTRAKFVRSSSVPALVPSNPKPYLQSPTFPDPHPLPPSNPPSGCATPEAAASHRELRQSITSEDDELPHEGGPAEDSDYGSIRSGGSEKASSMALITGINDLGDSDIQLAPLYQPSPGQTPNNQWNATINERPPLVFYHLEGRPKTASSMDWEIADQLSDLDSGQEEIVLGVSPSQLERLFFSNDYIEVMEVPTYGQVKYVSFTLYDEVAPIPGTAVTVMKSARIEPPDRLIVGDTVTLHGPPPPPIPVPEIPRLPPPKVDSPTPAPSEPTPPPIRVALHGPLPPPIPDPETPMLPKVESPPAASSELAPPPIRGEYAACLRRLRGPHKEPTPPPVSKPKKRQIVKKKKEQPPPRVRGKPEESSAVPIGPPSEPSSTPLSEVQEMDGPVESPPGPTPDLEAQGQSPEVEVPEEPSLHETPPHCEEVPSPPENESAETISREEEEQEIVPDEAEESPPPSPVQSPGPSATSQDTLDLSDGRADTDSTESTPTPGEESPHPSEEESHALPPAVKDPEFLAQQERERLAEERRLKAYDMFDRLKARKFIPSDVTVETASKEGVKNMIHSHDGWLAQFLIIKEDKVKMYQQVFEVVDEDADGYLSCFETLMALKGITGVHNLTEQEEAYIIRVLELAEYPVTQGTDLRLFSVLASLSQRIVSVDDWVRNLINSLDLTSLEWKITRAKELFEWCLQEDSRRLQVDRLLVELKAGGVSAEHQEEVRATLGSRGSWDMIDFLSYLPLFIMTHSSVVDNPLDDSRVK